MPQSPALAPTLAPGVAIAVALVAALAALPARADDDAEREQLARISHELVQLQAMVAEIGRRAPVSQRVRFRYDWLQRDLDLMRQGIDDHIDAPRQPRPVPPLRGDYRQ
jgi:RAQPRD family integrative conjugative element protein